MFLELLKAGQSLMALEPATTIATMELIAIVAPTGKGTDITVPTCKIILRLHLQCLPSSDTTWDQDICLFGATLSYVLCGTRVPDRIN